MPEQYTPYDIIDLSVEEKPVDISAAFNALMGQKVLDAVAQKKIEVAKAMFGNSENQETPEENNDEVEYDEDDVEDEDFEYNDEDLEDYEFSDEDLEQLETEEDQDENS